MPTPYTNTTNTRMIFARGVNDTVPAIGPPDFSNSYTSTTLTSIIACTIPMFALLFLAAISWMYRYSLKNPKPINKASGYQVQRYAPIFYILLVLTSLGEIAACSWLLLQYAYHRNYPNVGIRSGVIILLFTACWTTTTASIFTLLFIHPTWSRHPCSSVGTQALWIFFTWVLWIIGSALVNSALPSLLLKGSCKDIVYCSQIRALFSLAVIESMMLSSSMLVMLWLAWQSTRDILQPSDIPLKGVVSASDVSP